MPALTTRSFAVSFLNFLPTTVIALPIKGAVPVLTSYLNLRGPVPHPNAGEGRCHLMAGPWVLPVSRGKSQQTLTCAFHSLQPPPPRVPVHCDAANGRGCNASTMQIIFQSSFSLIDGVPFRPFGFSASNLRQAVTYKSRGERSTCT